MSDILNKSIVLVLNRNWQAINIRTPADAFCQMATNVATALEIEFDGSANEASCHSSLVTRHPSALRPVTWDEWITLPVRDGDHAVRTPRGAIRVPTVIVAVNYARMPKKRPKLCARAIRDVYKRQIYEMASTLIELPIWKRLWPKGRANSRLTWLATVKFQPIGRC